MKSGMCHYMQCGHIPLHESGHVMLHESGYVPLHKSIVMQSHKNGHVQLDGAQVDESRHILLNKSGWRVPLPDGENV